ncbi:MAG: hypothetical protein Q8O52_01770 [Sulfuritalea sp.]|nr:hypothetical protein [Sulfuritalea sp.]
MSAETDARQQEVAAMFDRYGPAYRWWAVLTVMLGTVPAIMEATVVNVACPGPACRELRSPAAKRNPGCVETAGRQSGISGMQSALPEILRVFHVGHDQVQLLSTGFLAATTASMLLASWAMQRFGIRRSFVGALLLALFLAGRERRLDAVHGLQPMQEASS